MASMWTALSDRDYYGDWSDEPLDDEFPFDPAFESLSEMEPTPTPVQCDEPCDACNGTGNAVRRIR